MNNINPALASAAQTSYLQSNGLSDTTAKDPKVNEKTSVSSSSGGNTTVTLSEKNVSQKSDYLDLAKDRRINEKDSASSEATEKGETNNGLTYSSNLQAQANYNAISANKG